MVTEEFTLKIPVGDWMREYVREEPDVSTEEKIIEMATRDKVPTSQIGRFVIVAREAGAAPDEIIPANRLLLNAAAAASVQQIIASRHRELELPNQRTVKVREFIGPVKEVYTQVKADDIQPINELVVPMPVLEEGEAIELEEYPINQTAIEAGFVEVQSEAAQQRAIDYLLGRVPGYVYSRLAVIAVNGGDVAGIADRFKAEIDRIVGELT